MAGVALATTEICLATPSATQKNSKIKNPVVQFLSRKPPCPPVVQFSQTAPHTETLTPHGHPKFKKLVPPL